ncbi:MAG: AAA family ATPase, partial [Candidatus Lokiarchaeota archaeon]|nr:AAA family ATPase [Candidatus Lokiarchaeota archaeon]
MSIDIDKIREQIKLRHSDDEKQLEVIFSSNSRLLVEAPAGYGKTNTLISKIAYMIITNQIPYPSRLLALTFSVNAAYKIKKDVNSQIPELLNESAIDPNSKIFVSNYHGFCRSVLGKYGYLFHENLRKIDILQSIDDSNQQNLQQSVSGLVFTDAKKLSDFSDAVKRIDKSFIENNLDEYNSIVINELISREIISFNSILTLTLAIFRKYVNIHSFYLKYFKSILVDEYQDTNILSYYLLNELISDTSNVMLLGDSLQRIYGFIGAIPNLLTNSKTEFQLKKIVLNKNYRFADNEQMLLLDSNIRQNAEKPQSPVISHEANIEFEYLENQAKEANKIVNMSLDLIENDANSKIAILVKQRGNNINRIIDEFNSQGVPFFYGLFSDEDPNYVMFHKICLSEFIDLLKESDRITRARLRKFVHKIEEKIDNAPQSLVESLINLLGIFINKLFTDFAAWSNTDKIRLIKDTFEYNG